MKQIFTYGLFLLLMFSFNYKTISYCFLMTDISVTCFEDIDCEEKSESEKSDEKEKKTDEFKYLSLDHLHSLIDNYQLSVAHHSSLLYLTSDYSLGVYSPPEQA